MTHSIHKEGDILQIYICVIFCETRHHAQVHVTSGALVHCALSFSVKRTQTAEQWVCFTGHCLLWLLLLRLPAVVPLLLPPQNNLLTTSFRTRFLGGVSNQNFSYGFLLRFYLFVFWTLLVTHNCLSCLLICMTWHSFRHVIPVSMNLFYSDSKTDLKLWCDSCIKLPGIRGCPRRCCYIDGYKLHVTTPQPLEITPALQEACLWALL